MHDVCQWDNWWLDVHYDSGVIAMQQKNHFSLRGSRSLIADSHAAPDERGEIVVVVALCLNEVGM